MLIFFSQPTYEHVIHFRKTRKWSTNPDVMISLGLLIWGCSIFECATLFAAKISPCRWDLMSLFHSLKLHKMSMLLLIVRRLTSLQFS